MVSSFIGKLLVLSEVLITTVIRKKGDREFYNVVSYFCSIIQVARTH